MHWFWFLWVSSKPERQNKKESILLRFNFVKYQCAKNCNLMQTAMCTLMYFVKYKLAPWNDPDSQLKYVSMGFFFQIQSCKLQSSRIWNRYFFLKRSLYFFVNSMNNFITVAALMCLLRSSEVVWGHSWPKEIFKKNSNYFFWIFNFKHLLRVLITFHSGSKNWVSEEVSNLKASDLTSRL